MTQAQNPGTRLPEQHASFFRQSGWLMIANIVGGMLMWAVHLLAKRTGPEQYGLFVVFLATAMCIPTLPLQMVLAQQTAKALATGGVPPLRGLVRAVWLWTTLLWVVFALVVLAFQATILRRWNITNPAGLWVTVVVLLLGAWLPIFWGVLQGAQNFLWLGWSMMFNAIGRIIVAGIAVLALGAYAAGMMTGVLLGMAASAALALWQTRGFWTGTSAKFDWTIVKRQVLPLVIGFTSFQFLFTTDTVFAGLYFDEKTVGFYGSAGTMSRALMWLVGPLTAVMFPRIVHSAAKAEKSDLMGLVLGGTAFLALSGAAGLALLGPWVIKLVYGETFVEVASTLLPWYAGAMIPLALTNVLLNNLMARNQFKVVPGLVLLAATYGFALTRFHDTPVMLLQTMMAFNSVLLALCAYCTWRPGRVSRAG